MALGKALAAVGAVLFAGSRALRPGLVRFSGSELVAVEGRSNMAKNCELFEDKRVVLVTVTMDYFDMFTNWVNSAKPFLHATEHLHIIAEDEDVLAPIEAFLHDQKLDVSVGTPNEPSSVLSLQPPYGSLDYASVVWKRPDHLARFLRAGCSVLYVDIDTVWMKDPFIEIEAAGSGDLYLSDDSPPPETGTFRNFCTCFMYIHPSDATESLLQSWSSRMDDHRNQGIFNHALADAVEANTAPTVQVLPVAQFPPGNVVILKGHSDILEGAPPDPTVYHANWREGSEGKIHFFNVLGMWNPTPIVQ